ncbi:carbohydrate ABC transporter permease [Cohnella endophytica]|uniref:Carbohydrate ABC transporter permease n=1 Tax=Cohnella endophytica TaxID=2419778 RepID=A0A494XTU1_9BACL|nr:carbohydrate ABC transporter permease [Cohnella endophytica]RKP51544.1 carbohydrate ABC transporter permease [Cohnella endophytica]
MNRSLSPFMKPIGKGLMWIVTLLYIYPILLVLLSAVKSKSELAMHPFGWPKKWTFDAFSKAFDTMHYLRSLLNTVGIAAISVAGVVLMAAMAAYVISRRDNRFYRGMYLVFLAGMIVPFQMAMIPLYKVLQTFHLINTYQGVIFIYLGMLAPFSVFILSGFVKGVPKELEEAAFVDGSGTYKTFFRIVLPLLKPAVTTVTVLNLFNVWNDFLMPMLYLSDSHKSTITVQLSAFQGMYNNDWSQIFAGVCLIVVPMLVIYLFAQRFIISGITAGAVKG